MPSLESRLPWVDQIKRSLFALIAVMECPHVLGGLNGECAGIAFQGGFAAVQFVVRSREKNWSVRSIFFSEKYVNPPWM